MRRCVDYLYFFLKYRLYADFTVFGEMQQYRIVHNPHDIALYG